MFLHRKNVNDRPANEPRAPQYYREKLALYKILSHLTVEVVQRQAR